MTSFTFRFRPIRVSMMQAATVVGIVAGCAAGPVASPTHAPVASSTQAPLATPSAHPAATVSIATAAPATATAASATASAGAGTLPLPEGRITPGRYRFVVDNKCDGCPTDASVPPNDIALTITVPAGYSFWHEWSVIEPNLATNSGPHGAAIALGWTKFYAALYSDPCLHAEDPLPDVPVGPTVDDFAKAVAAHPDFDVTEPVGVTLGRHGGKFFTLTGPSDLSGCTNWQPWAPGFYVQGENNIWDVWTIDVDGFRVVIADEYFPGTSSEIKTQIRDMVESIEFAPIAASS